MSTQRNRQRELFPRSKSPTIALAEDHPVVMLTDMLDWTELEERAQKIRDRKLKNAAGRPPHLRALLGALTLMAVRRMPYRETEDQIRYYAPARYMCGLTETDWTPDFTTIQDFAQLLGEDGVRLMNEYVVELAVKLGLADPRVAVADTTAQEAAIPYPNEVGLITGFVRSIESAARRVGGKVKGFLRKAGRKIKVLKRQLRGYRLFGKSKEDKDRMLARIVDAAAAVSAALGKTLATTEEGAQRLRGHGIVAREKLSQLHQMMGRLLPQIRYWLRTGRVAAGKVIHPHMTALYAIVRGKVGKAVEFGLSWGITRLQGGFVIGRRAQGRNEIHDQRYAVLAVEDLRNLFGQVPKAYGYDRGGFSLENLKRLRQKGVRHVGLAPQGALPWAVSERMRRKLSRERALVEASIGTIKQVRYGFNRPAAKSVPMMGTCGQRALLGANLVRLAQKAAMARA